MSDVDEYTRREMLNSLIEYYDRQDYKTDPYSIRFLPARVPLYCIKTDEGKTEEIVVEITTDMMISKDDFFRDLTLGEVMISHASPVRFYQYYFPKAKIYYAYPDYAKETDGFNDFKEICIEHGIGLLKTSKTKIEEIVKPHSLFDQICTQLVKNKKTRKGIENIIGEHFESYLHQLVYYPEPEYKRRAITRREDEDFRISLMLLKKLQDPQNIRYGNELKILTSDYLLKEKRDDFEIASDYVTTLWKKYLGLEYPNPNIQIKFEEIFLKEFGYREHFLHQFQVFLLGSYIIDKLYDSRKKTLDKFKESYGIPIEIAWLATSTYHDFNYSTQKYQFWLSKYLKDVLRLEKKEVLNELSKLNLDVATVREKFLLSSEKLINIICENYHKNSENIKDKINIFLYEKIVKKRNHGLISSSTLLKIYNNGGKKIKIPKKGIEQAALAIALHDEKMWEFFCGCKGFLLEEKKCQGNCKKKNSCEVWDKDIKNCEILDTINFDKEPLIYLLILCDSAQDEGRVQQESSGIKTIIEDIQVGKDGRILITLVTDDTISHRIKQSEFSRVEQFLDDGKFEIILKPRKTSFGKEKVFIV